MYNISIKNPFKYLLKRGSYCINKIPIQINKGQQPFQLKV